MTLRLRLCCAWLWLRSRHIHSSLWLVSHRHVLSGARSWRLRNLRLRHYLTSLRLPCTRNVLPATWAGLLRLLTVSYRFSTSLLDRVPLRTLLLDLLLPLLLRRNTLRLFPANLRLTLLLLQILQLSPCVAITLCRFRR